MHRPVSPVAAWGMDTTSTEETYDRAMKQLSGMDVSFLNMETNSVFGHVASVNIFDPEGAPGGAGVEATKQVILERIDQLAPFRRRLVEVPLGLDLPYWIEDPDFDIDFHVRHHAVPAPGTPEQLAEVVSRIHARPLDRSGRCGSCTSSRASTVARGSPS